MESFETFLLYYFSAIAQVVGAVIALGGVFLVFYIQSLNIGILDSANKIKNSNLNIVKYYVFADILRSKIESVTEDIGFALESENVKRICEIFNDSKLPELLKDIYNSIEHHDRFIIENKKIEYIKRKRYINIVLNILTISIFNRKESFKYFKRSFFIGSVVILLSLSFIIFSYFKILPLNIIAIVSTFTLTIFVLMNIYKIVKTSFD
jgi:hypothetical protein